MPEVLPPPRDRHRSEGGFTLLEIMVALAILAVGAICVLATFATALALHMQREEKDRLVRVLDEAMAEAQTSWDAHRPTKDRPCPPAIKDMPYSRDASLSYSVIFSTAEGIPRGLDGAPSGVLAQVSVVREGLRDHPKEETRVLWRAGFRPEDMKESLTFEQEKKDDKKKYDPGDKKGR